MKKIFFRLSFLSLVFELFLFCLTLSLLSQFAFTPFYGKNKVQYSHFRWNYLTTEHFKIYLYSRNEDALKLLTLTAESAYQKISQLMKHELREQVPLIYYENYTDFEQTNLFQVSEGVLGVSEPVLHRIAIHGDLPPDELQTLIEHELSHIFQFDFLWGKQEGSLYALRQPPLWTMEGLSEFVTGKWSSWSKLIVRDAVLNDRVPEFSESGELVSRYPLPREPAYDFGHTLYEFIQEKFGPNAINEFWRALKNFPQVSLFAKSDPWKKTFGLTLKEFSQAYRRYLREKHKKFYLRENPADYSQPLGPEFPSNPYYFAFSSALSPSGELAAVLTYNVRNYDLNIVLVSTRDGRVVKNLTPGHSTRYQSIKFQIDPSYGQNLCWSKDGKTIAFFVRKGQKYALALMDAYTGTISRQIKIMLDEPASPSFHPLEEALIFTAFKAGRRDIFRIDLKTGELQNLTDDKLYEKSAEYSPDGKAIAYTIRDGEYDRIILSPESSFQEKTQLTFGSENAICPHFSSDGQRIFFSGDNFEAFNLYSLDLKTGERRRYTDVQTGNFFPSPVPGKEKLVIFCSFNKGSFQLFKAELEGVLETPVTPSNFEPTSYSLVSQAEKVQLDQSKFFSYQGLGKLYLTSRPPIQAVLTSDGSFYGASALAFSDLLADHNFIFLFSQFREFRSYYFSYLNQKRRFQYMLTAFQYSLFYYPSLYYYDPALYENLTYRDALAVRSLSGISFDAYYPFSLYSRAELSLGFSRYSEDFLDPGLLAFYSRGSYGYFTNGNYLSASLTLVGETTFFKEFGPLAGQTFRLGITQAIPLTRNYINNTTATADLRKYFYLGADSLLAFRWEGFLSRGKTPFVFYWGGNNQLRSAYFYNIVGTEGWYFNAELRFPLVNYTSTIIGTFGPIRGVVFFDLTRARMKGYPPQFYEYLLDESGPYLQTYDAIGSVGYGFLVFFLGLPLHFDLAKPLSVEKISRPANLRSRGSFKLRFWIGYDF